MWKIGLLFSSHSYFTYVCSMLHTSRVSGGEFRIKKATLESDIFFWHVFCFCKHFCFFFFFFWWSIKFLQQNINQPETGIGGKKLLSGTMELYSLWWNCMFISLNNSFWKSHLQFPERFAKIETVILAKLGRKKSFLKTFKFTSFCFCLERVCRS